jgi:REP element-mobilizing transposase RayT
LVEIDGEQDHVHLLVNYAPKTSVSRLINSLKGFSSRILKKNHRIYGVLTGEMPYGLPVILPLHVAEGPY